MAFNPANVLTSLRLVLVPVFLILLWNGSHGYALAVFIFAALTDMIDGTVARMFEGSSKFGARLDPIADKLLVESAFCSLWLMGAIPFWFFMIALVRDILIITGIFYLEWKNIEFAYKPSWISKFATLFQATLASMGVVLVGGLGPSWPWNWLWPLTIIVTLVLILWSAVIYFNRARKLLTP